MVLQQAVSALRGSEAQRCSELSGRYSPGPTSNSQARSTATPPEYNLAKVLDGLKDNEHFKDSEELAAMQAKMDAGLGS